MYFLMLFFLARHIGKFISLLPAQHGPLENQISIVSPLGKITIHLPALSGPFKKSLIRLPGPMQTFIPSRPYGEREQIEKVHNKK